MHIIAYSKQYSLYVLKTNHHPKKFNQTDNNRINIKSTTLGNEGTLKVDKLAQLFLNKSYRVDILKCVIGVPNRSITTFHPLFWKIEKKKHNCKEALQCLNWLLRSCELQLIEGTQRLARTSLIVKAKPVPQWVKLSAAFPLQTAPWVLAMQTIPRTWGHVSIPLDD